MKCPVCAESLQDDATKYRFCGQTMTKAVRLGWPEVYRNSAGLGYLELGMLLIDYQVHLGLPISGGCLSPVDPVGCLLNEGGAADFAAERAADKFDKLDAKSRSALQQFLDSSAQSLRQRAEQSEAAPQPSAAADYPRPVPDGSPAPQKGNAGWLVIVAMLGTLVAIGATSVVHIATAFSGAQDRSYSPLPITIESTTVLSPSLRIPSWPRR